MNQISFTCSNNHPFKVPAKFAGKRAKCPKCGEVVTIPQVSTLTPTSQIFSSNHDLENCGFTDGLSPLAASVANSYTQNQVANKDGNRHFNASSWVFSGGTVLLVLVLILTGNWPTSLSFSNLSQTVAVSAKQGDTGAAEVATVTQPVKQSGNDMVHLTSATQPAKKKREPVGEEVTISQIYLFGRDYIGKKVRFSNVMFKNLNEKAEAFQKVALTQADVNDWEHEHRLGELPVNTHSFLNSAKKRHQDWKNKFVTFSFGDRQRSRIFNLCEKQEWGMFLARLRTYDEIVVEGKIVELEDSYYDSNNVGLEVTHIELVKAYRSQ